MAPVGAGALQVEPNNVMELGVRVRRVRVRVRVRLEPRS